MDLSAPAPGDIGDLAEAITPMRGSERDYERVLHDVGASRIVLIGDGTHGTHDFYRVRADITKQLITQCGFTAVAVEADWPDAYRVNRYVQGFRDDAGAGDALAGFTRFPLWMWRNRDVLEFVEWLRAYNGALPSTRMQVGFYGLDLYSMRSSMAAVLQYLDAVDPAAAQRARFRYACFDHFGDDEQAYGYAAGFQLTETCEQDVISQLVELQRHAPEYTRRDARVAADEFFYAEQNARLVKNAEQYYRCMFRGRVSSWNIRDRHMADTVEALINHLGVQHAKIVVWAHNSHLGDARATQMGEDGEISLGQLVRERYGTQSLSIGCTTYRGTVAAAAEWDAPVHRQAVRPARPDSYEALFHCLGTPQFYLPLRHVNGALPALHEPRLERAIGVIYRPQSEGVSHYFSARLRQQFDAIIHIDETTAVEPLDRTPHWDATDLPETYPSVM